MLNVKYIFAFFCFHSLFSIIYYFTELPLPIHVFFESKGLRVTIWFGFAGHFTNKVYVFTNVDRIPNEILGEDNAITFEKDSDYIARLRFRNVILY